VFLMDEPLSNLDAKLRVEARSFISKLHQRLGTTFVYVTHDQTEAMTMGTRIAVMNGGELQQIDSPSTLYSHPANVFVAGFIGSPSMNFFNTTIVDEGGKLHVDAGNFRIPMPVSRYENYKGYVGKDIILGIRPEDMHDPAYQPTNIEPATIEANVDVVEQMGFEKLVYLEDSGKTFIARMDPRTSASVGQRIPVVIDVSNVHLFDAQTEKALQ
jgi:multiple sugar transport system ATP-binding protein